MLLELKIENFAIIDRIDIQFGPGLIIFTGETGAGKSIIIDALEALLGGRVETTMIRTGADRAVVEGVFSIKSCGQQELPTLLSQEGLLDDPDTLILAREIRQGGRSFARVNGRSVSISFLKQLGEMLVDIHGQSEHLSLLRVNRHLDLLDQYAGVSDTLQTYQGLYRQLSKIRHELDSFRNAEREAARQTDMLRFQITEIESAHLKPGEEEELTTERNRLANAENLAKLIQESNQALEEGTPETPSAIDLIGKVVDYLHDLVRIDPSKSTLHERSQVLFEEIADISRELRLYQEQIEFNPKRLDQIETRLSLLQMLKKKYGDTIKDVLTFAESAKKQLDNITHAEERIQALEQNELSLLSELRDAGLELSEQRRQKASLLADQVERELADLHMSQTIFKTDFQQHIDPQGILLDDGRRVAFDQRGIEHVEFLIAPNPGEGLKPLVKIASGGETSRLMLALKHVLVSADHIPCLIFDEIDQGIGGRVGAIVGQKLWNLARSHQVFCITHLPQLAAFGDQHFNVHKIIEDGRTITQVTSLDKEERVQELAQMLGGVSQSTIQSAREMVTNIKSN